MSTHFGHPGLGVLELLAALTLGFWLGARHAMVLPGLMDFVQSLLGT
jgi:hypothetical protein